MKELKFDEIDELLGEEPSAEDFEEVVEVRPRSWRFKLAAIFFAGLVALYHVDNVKADQIVSGSKNVNGFTVAWEYNLTQTTGKIMFTNYVLWSSFQADNYKSLYLDLIPEESIITQVDPDVQVFQSPSTSCMTSAFINAIRIPYQTSQYVTKTIQFNLPASDNGYVVETNRSVNLRLNTMCSYICLMQDPIYPSSGPMLSFHFVSVKPVDECIIRNAGEIEPVLIDP